MEANPEEKMKKMKNKKKKERKKKERKKKNKIKMELNRKNNTANISYKRIPNVHQSTTFVYPSPSKSSGAFFFFSKQKTKHLVIKGRIKNNY